LEIKHFFASRSSSQNDIALAIFLLKKGIQRDRETERQRDRETERQRNIETEKQRNREKYKHRNREIEKQRYLEERESKQTVWVCR
jgi:hypothetical protein